MRYAAALAVLMLPACLSFPPAPPALVVDAEPPLFTTENGDTASFKVALSAAPVADVVVSIASALTDEATVTPSSLVFTPDTWGAPQTVVIHGVDDAVATADGDVAYTIAMGPTESQDAVFAGLTAELSGVNNDNDEAGFFVDDGDGVVVSEIGTQDSFRVSLRTRPTASVSLTPSLSPTGRVGLSPETVLLDTDNWSTGVVVTVTGLEDSPAMSDGDEVVALELGTASSVDHAYEDLAAPNVTAIARDDDVAEILVTSKAAISLLENETAHALTSVVLGLQPAGTVTVQISVGLSGRATVSPTSINFTTSNWHIPVPVTVSGFDDSFRNGDADLEATFGSAIGDPAYNGKSSADKIPVTLHDDERQIVLLDFPVSGAFDSAGFLASIDSFCSAQEAGATYKALLIAGSRMPDSETWIMRPGYNYMRDTATVIQRADPRGELRVPLQNPTTGTDDYYWTGIRSAPGPVWVQGQTCGNWASDSSNETGTTGRGSSTSTAFEGVDPGCDAQRRVLCVEQ